RNLAAIYCNQRRLEKAEQLLKECLELQETLENNTIAAEILQELAALYIKKAGKENLKVAKGLLIEAKAIALKVKDLVLLINVLLDLGNCYRQLKEIEQAL